MRKKLLTCIFAAGALCLGCSGSGETVKTNAPNAANASTPEVRVVEPVVNIDLPPASANRVRQPDTIQDRANRPPRPDANPNATPVPLQFKPAPENSEAAFEMTADGNIREVRIFKGHPKLVRVESLSPGGATRYLTITLRGGKVVKAQTDRIDSLANASSAMLAGLAGVK